MTYLFDASSIFKAIIENKVEILIGNATIDLATYETGNILWKNYALKAKAKDSELKNLAQLLRQTLNILKTIQITPNQTEDILDIAVKLKLTFYDAAYAYTAKTNEATLVTQDSELQRKTTQYVKTSTLDEIYKTETQPTQ